MRVLADKAEYDACLADCATRGRLLVVDFTATWCGPCQRIAPVFEALAKEFPQVTFVKVDVDENQETAQACQVSAMPTFKGYQAKSEVFSIRGADEATLRAEISKNAGSKFEGVGQRLGGGDVAGAAPAGNMSEREKRLAALERRGLCGGGGSGGSTAPAAPASVASEVPASPAAVSLAAVAPAAVAPTAPVSPPGSYMDQVNTLLSSQVQARRQSQEDDAAMAARVAREAAAAEAAAGGGGGASDDEQAMLEAAIAASLTTGPAEVLAPPSAPPAPPAPPDFTEQKEMLRGMGFTDDVANQVALEGAGGDVQRALELLL